MISEIIKSRGRKGKTQYRYYDSTGKKALGPWRGSKRAVRKKDVGRVQFFKNKGNK